MYFKYISTSEVLRQDEVWSNKRRCAKHCVRVFAVAAFRIRSNARRCVKWGSMCVLGPQSPAPTPPQPHTHIPYSDLICLWSQQQPVNVLSQKCGVDDWAAGWWWNVCCCFAIIIVPFTLVTTTVKGAAEAARASPGAEALLLVHFLQSGSQVFAVEARGVGPEQREVVEAPVQ